MAETKRAFRSPASYEAEARTRSFVKPFLEQRGFTNVVDERTPVGEGESQVVIATDASGNRLKMRVRTCWHWGKARGERTRKFSAAQVTARVKGSWADTLDNIVQRQVKAGVTHVLLVQADDQEIHMAALIPVKQIRAIWEKQREVSIRVINAGEMGRVRKNHAENGDSPTLWLMDNRAPGGKAVADVLWGWKGVVDIAKTLPTRETVDDTYDDLDSDVAALYGTDGAERKRTTRSEVKRDVQVRKAVIARATGGCERPSCNDTRRYRGFLDVHHILGAEKSDRVWTCVALCPNCHREAHYAPDHEKINAELLEYAAQFAPTSVRAA
jgi:5-methylcytosine-specific restriction enzyme A